MRVKVVGDCVSARALRTGLGLLGYAVVEHFPSYTIYLSEDPEADEDGPVVVDGVHCLLESNIVGMLGELLERDIILRRAIGEVHSDSEISILVPPDDVARVAVEEAIRKGFQKTVSPKRGWFQ